MPSTGKDVADSLARALCKADGKVWWTEHIPAVYHYQARNLLAAGWRVIPPTERGTPMPNAEKDAGCRCIGKPRRDENQRLCDRLCPGLEESA